jgi:hypothetical protein
MALTFPYRQGECRMKRLWVAAALSIVLPTLANASCADDDLWICKLKPYEPDPTVVNTDNTSPKCNGKAPTGLKKKIQDAYDAIPGDLPGDPLFKFKNDLCQVDHIFVTSGADHSWGRYNDPLKHPNDNPGSRYIAIDSADINKPFKAKQDDHLKNLSPGGNSVFHTAFGQNSNDVRFGLLFSLAHELAHIKWHEAYPLTTGTGSGVPCYDNAFGRYWDSTDSAKTNRWTQFGQSNLGKPQGVVPPGQASPDELFDIYNKGFATGLAAANPEEDFVESYALGVVNRACGDCLFSINSAAGSTTLTNRSPVDAKIACVATNYLQ